VHEMTHWIMDHSVNPKVPYRRDGGEHQIPQLQNASIAITEGYAEYHQSFWGSEFGRIDGVRGFALAGNYTLRDVFRTTGTTRTTTYVFGGPVTAPPTFVSPGLSVDCEGYFCNALWQVHHALAEPGILLADSPAYWYGYNGVLSDAQAERYAKIMRGSLRIFPAKPSDEDYEKGSRTYARQLLHVAADPRQREIVASLLELNNLVNPVLTVSQATVNVAKNAVANLSAVVKDFDGQPLPGYSVAVVASSGAIAFTGAAPARRRGVQANAQATDATGTVNFTYTAPAAAGAQTITVSVQPDFDDDATFAPPQARESLETTQTQLYLYELRGANKTWTGTGNNRGAIVSRQIKVQVT
jgi:hypothetical protein